MGKKITLFVEVNDEEKSHVKIGVNTDLGLFYEYNEGAFILNAINDFKKEVMNCTNYEIIISDKRTKPNDLEKLELYQRERTLEHYCKVKK